MIKSELKQIIREEVQKLNEINKKAESLYTTLEKHHKELKPLLATMKKYSKGGHIYFKDALESLNGSISELVNDALYEGVQPIKLKKKDGSGQGRQLNKGQQCDEDEIPGGVGDGMSDGEVCSKQLEVGIAVEREHTTDVNKAKEIALDHLSEDPAYYTKLIKSGLVDEPEAIKLAKKLGMMEAKDVPDHFKKLAQIIVNKKGNFSAKDFEKLNIPFEVFLQMAQLDNKKLVQNAQKVLKQ